MSEPSSIVSPLPQTPEERIKSLLEKQVPAGPLKARDLSQEEIMQWRRISEGLKDEQGDDSEAFGNVLAALLPSVAYNPPVLTLATARTLLLLSLREDAEEIEGLKRITLDGFEAVKLQYCRNPEVPMDDWLTEDEAENRWVDYVAFLTHLEDIRTGIAECSPKALAKGIPHLEHNASAYEAIALEYKKDEKSADALESFNARAEAISMMCFLRIKKGEIKFPEWISPELKSECIRYASLSEEQVDEERADLCEKLIEAYKPHTKISAQDYKFVYESKRDSGEEFKQKAAHLRDFIETLEEIIDLKKKKINIEPLNSGKSGSDDGQWKR